MRLISAEIRIEQNFKFCSVQSGIKKEESGIRKEELGNRNYYLRTLIWNYLPTANRRFLFNLELGVVIWN
jgi:hypothetical protein